MHNQGISTSGTLAEQGEVLMDRFARRISYLRVSVTEHCNFRCVYCTPETGTPYFHRDEHLTATELERLLRIFARLGLQHVRFTGGEPLIHPQIVDYVRMARDLGIGKISISTNGLLLDRLAVRLRDAGLNNLNISLDALDPQIFARITRGGDVHRVLRGIATARQAGIPRIKLNVVLLGQDNQGEILGLTRYALETGIDLRFIETMPLGSAGHEVQEQQYFSATEARALLESVYGPLRPAETIRDQGPARLFQLGDNASPRIGFITPISENFCSNCNRVRLTAHGMLVYCLGHEAGLDLRHLLRSQVSDLELAERIRAGVWHGKPERHEFVTDRGKSSRIFMMRLGG